MDLVNEYLEAHYEVYHSPSGRYTMLEIRPRIVCKDGFNMSVQASRHHYCTPRTDRGPYGEVEVGFPSERVEALMPYIDGNPETTDPIDTLYAYVPMDVVLSIIGEHGGLDVLQED